MFSVSPRILSTQALTRQLPSNNCLNYTNTEYTKGDYSFSFPLALSLDSWRQGFSMVWLGVLQGIQWKQGSLVHHNFPEHVLCKRHHVGPQGGSGEYPMQGHVILEPILLWARQSKNSLANNSLCCQECTKGCWDRLCETGGHTSRVLRESLPEKGLSSEP